MNKREFNNILDGCLSENGKIIDPKKVDALSDDIKERMMYFITRNKAPLMKEFMPKNINRSWLSSCGYLYESVSSYSGFTFIHTGEHFII